MGRRITKLSRVQPITSPLDASPPPAEIDDEPTFNYDLVLEDFPDTLQCNLVISSAAFVPPDFSDQTLRLSRLTEGSRPDVSCMARCIAIIDEPLSLKSSPSGPVQEEAAEQADNSSSAESRNAVDTGVLVFPPSTVSGGSTTHSCIVFINGEGSLATPKGKCTVLLTFNLLRSDGEYVFHRAYLHRPSSRNTARHFDDARNAYRPLSEYPDVPLCRPFESPPQTTIHDILSGKAKLCIW